MANPQYTLNNKTQCTICGQNQTRLVLMAEPVVCDSCRCNSPEAYEYYSEQSRTLFTRKIRGIIFDAAIDFKIFLYIRVYYDKNLRNVVVHIRSGHVNAQTTISQRYMDQDSSDENMKHDLINMVHTLADTVDMGE